MSEIDKYEALVHKLSYHQNIISNILETPCSNKSVKLAAIERKIVALEELVLELPYGDGSGLFEEWRDTVSDLYRTFFLLACEKVSPKKAVSSGKIASKVVSTEKSATSEEIENGIETSATGVDVTSSGAGKITRMSKKKSQSSTSGEQGDDRVTHTSRRSRPAKQTYPSKNFRRSVGISSADKPAVEKSVEEQKEELRASFVGIFSQLEPVAEITVDSDLEGLRLLAMLVNRSIRQLSPFEDDTELLSNVLSYALPKAPKSVIERFNSMNEAEEMDDADPKRPPLKGLRLLKKCLIAELTSFYEAVKAALVTEDGGDSGDVVDGQTCYFCKSNGHYKSRCPLVRGVLSLALFL